MVTSLLLTDSPTASAVAENMKAAVEHGAHFILVHRHIIESTSDRLRSTSEHWNRQALKEACDGLQDSIHKLRDRSIQTSTRFQPVYDAFIAAYEKAVGAADVYQESIDNRRKDWGIDSEASKNLWQCTRLGDSTRLTGRQITAKGSPQREASLDKDMDIRLNSSRIITAVTATEAVRDSTSSRAR